MKTTTNWRKIVIVPICLLLILVSFVFVKLVNFNDSEEEVFDMCDNVNVHSYITITTEGTKINTTNYYEFFDLFCFGYDGTIREIENNLANTTTYKADGKNDAECIYYTEEYKCFNIEIGDYTIFETNPYNRSPQSYTNKQLDAIEVYNSLIKANK